MNSPLQHTKQRKLFALLDWRFRKFTRVLTTVFSIAMNIRNWMLVLSVTWNGTRSGKMILVISTGSPLKKVPAKVMWYFPIIPRLKRIFRNKDHAKLMRWHKEERKQDQMLRHPADGSQWRNVDREFLYFDMDPRNIRFGLSMDGMNPFGEWGSSHSTWPVTLCMFNLPSWLSMKRKYMMMSVLIQGPK